MSVLPSDCLLHHSHRMIRAHMEPVSLRVGGDIKIRVDADLYVREGSCSGVIFDRFFAFPTASLP